MSRIPAFRKSPSDNLKKHAYAIRRGDLYAIASIVGNRDSKIYLFVCLCVRVSRVRYFHNYLLTELLRFIIKLCHESVRFFSFRSYRISSPVDFQILRESSSSINRIPLICLRFRCLCAPAACDIPAVSLASSSVQYTCYIRARSRRFCIEWSSAALRTRWYPCITKLVDFGSR